MTTWLKRAGISAGAIVILLVAFAAFVALRPVGEEPTAPISGAPANLQTQVQRGEYLAKAADCVACHTTKGGEPLAGGLAFKMPFGTIYATNISADKEHGIGNWSDDEFVSAVRQGISPHGNLYPAMPYTSYTAMSRDDVLAIKAWLMSQPPVAQANRQNDLGFPFDQRWAMKFWNAAFFRERRFVPLDSSDAELNRGAYLATALGHCGECHTPRNLGFAMDQGHALAGAEIQGWFAPNISSNPDTGLGQWSPEQISQYLAQGHAPGRSSAAGPMAEVIENSLQYLTPEDNQALVKYLQHTLPADNGDGIRVNLQPAGAMKSTALLPGDQNDSAGRQLFAGDCSGCHQWNGPGRVSQHASLAGSTTVNDPKGRSLVQVILKGTHMEVGDQQVFMPDFGNKYSDAEVASVANFVIGHFGGKQGEVTAEQVKQQRDK
ncbi:MAG: cytochrome c [Pantoea sp.]|uniref:cytochrome c n=1 Tax=Pantoea sp. TaxID=69393 RepID=UPI0023A55ED2|nr:cytochrome c [Pantoea sp.]MDE1189042.1 cytochrome c [Pantoea sp.]